MIDCLSDLLYNITSTIIIPGLLCSLVVVVRCMCSSVEYTTSYLGVYHITGFVYALRPNHAIMFQTTQQASQA